ncbi:DUF4166 domain-containing protein [Tahibacter amnicola]|uniref:DUF4166 domain-containing protein n=1 Tax=Tahibacter amnicola TaxID=2976241 RepID=A0ABY6BNX0_9GAMM|nr:DUF4166 domain-containing protein [Tahibacter amnicola]UXI70745.1 DUF4166 domain-containing protein [Tahibacter amnicola]
MRTLHTRTGPQRYRGQATIRRGRSLLSRLCAWATGLPPALADAPLEVEIDASAGRETWTRWFGPHRMQSRLRNAGGLLGERLGLVHFRFHLAVDAGSITWTVVGVRALGVPLPAAWFRGVWARECEQDGRYRFEVAAALPLAGELVHYQGWLTVPSV